MPLRLIATIAGTEDRTAKVYRDAEWQEYRVRLFVSGKLYSPADSFHSDRTDALFTANAMVRTHEVTK